MSEIVNESLRKIAKGTMIVFIGTIVGLLLGFVSRILLIRFTTQSEYGIYCLALTVVSIFVTISTLGLGEGSTRYIAYFRGKREEGNVRGVISSTIKIALAASAVLAAISFFISDFISVNIFHTPELSTPLKIFSISIPFTVLITVFIAIFRGFDRVDAKVYFQDILRPVLFLLFLIAIVLFGQSFIGVVYAYVLSIAITCVVFVIYLLKKSPLSIGKNSIANPITKELLFFSVPLLAVSMLMMVMSWTDTLMLGYFKTPDVVGVYNAALPLAQLIGIPMGALLLIYGPITTGLYAQNSVAEMGRNYAVITKWVFSATLPLFLLLFLFPDIVLNFLFGANYMLASQVLRILSLGFIIVNLLGPNGTTLVAIGKTKFLMWAIVAAAGTNIALNVALIPQWGIAGAATATTASITLHCMIRHVKVHAILGINPLTKNLLKPMISSISIIFIIYLLVGHFLNVTFWMLPLLFILFYAVYFMVILFSRSLDQEDIMVLLEIEKRMGLNFSKIKNVIKKFIK